MTAILLEHTSTDHEELQEKLQRVRGQVWGGYATLPQSVPKQSAPVKVMIRLRTQQPSVQDQAKPFNDDTHRSPRRFFSPFPMLSSSLR